ncbi:Uncharacterized membrane protein [Austwickia chelonae]|uniref:DUF979 domain-containing protein n=1 Tax=Austwickia chelonae NBRC 105200 TaxID=1184607 RepID=K6V9H1_9MICO|nr:DUF979 domain-containing protein [Austwickia chelonae]GAB78883.1 hypothetical protein AUCHE_17_00950 [Austwickia chelonae NBRC 105200]SEV85854.1 Uncharacterized membrane protein [Austwickia chelonae]
MIQVEWLYWLVGAFFVVLGGQAARDRSVPRRHLSGLFWILLGVGFWYSTFVVAKSAPAWVLGLIVLTMAVLAGMGLPHKGTDNSTTDEERQVFARRFGNKLFVPALTIPFVTAIFATGLVDLEVDGRLLLEKGSATIIGLAVASLIALAVAVVLLRPKSPAVPLQEGRRLLGHIGWTAVLPQMLATLGVLFQVSGVGKAVGEVAGGVLPKGSVLAAVALYCVGMAAFTMVMGNAFAAFPVMTAAIGWPLLVQHYGGEPTVIFAVGMLAGFCGTLATPMAANFNLVPAALLEMKDQYGPIKAQLPTAVALLACNVGIITVFAF